MITLKYLVILEIEKDGYFQSGSFDNTMEIRNNFLKDLEENCW